MYNSLVYREVFGKLYICQAVEYPYPPFVARVLFLMMQHIEGEEGWEDPLKYVWLDELVARVNVDPILCSLPQSCVPQTTRSKEAMVSSQMRKEAPE